MTRLFVRLLPTTLRDRLLISLIEECCKYGDAEYVYYFYKFMTLFLSNIQSMRG